MTVTAQPQSEDPAAAQIIVPPPRQRFCGGMTARQRLVEFVWRWIHYLLFRTSPVSANAWRCWLLRRFGAEIDSGVVIHPSVLVYHPYNLRLEEGVVILHCVVLDCRGPIRIGRQTRISQFTHLCTTSYQYDRRDMPLIIQPITIDPNCWLAADVFVGYGVAIGRQSVLGARCSVFHDVPPGVVVAGASSRKSHAASPIE